MAENAMIKPKKNPDRNIWEMPLATQLGRCSAAHLALVAAWRNLEASRPIPGFFALGILNCPKWHDLQGYTLFDMLNNHLEKTYSERHRPLTNDPSGLLQLLGLGIIQMLQEFLYSNSSELQIKQSIQDVLSPAATFVSL
eukprot:scaffold5848_cov66-Cylindrotheca_fusiformis.AAC.1